MKPSITPRDAHHDQPVAGTGELLSQTGRLRRGISLGLFAIAFAAALHFYGVGYNHLFLVVTSLCAIAAITLLGPGLAHQAFRRSPLGVSLALLSLLMLVIQQNFFSINFETSFSQTWVLAAAPLWFLIVVAMTRTVPNAPAPGVSDSFSIPFIYCLVLGIVSVMVLVAGVGFLWHDIRPHEPLVDTSNFGSIVYLTLVPATHWWLTSPSSKAPVSPKAMLPHLLMGALFLLSSLAIWATQSRACTWLLALVVVFWVALGLFGRVVLVRALFVAALFVAGFLLAGKGPDTPPLDVAQELSADASIEERFMLTDAGLELARLHAPWGSGAYTFGMLYPTVRSHLEQASGGRLVHNDYVQFAAEGGVWFLLPLLLFAVTVIWSSARLTMRVGGVREPLAQRYLGGWVALAMLLAHALVNYVFYTLAIGMLIGVVSAWAINATAASQCGDEDRKPESRGFLLGWLGTVGFAWLCLFYLILDNTDLAVFSGQQGLPGAATLREDVAAQARYASLSHRLNGDRSLPLLVMALQARNEVLRNPDRDGYLKSEAGFQAAIAANPWNSDAYLQYADLVLALGPRWMGQEAAIQQADELLDRALIRAPLDLALLQRKAQRLTQTDGPRAAFDWLMATAFPWLEYLGVQSMERTLGLVEELGRRSLALDDQDAFERIRIARGKLLQLEQPAELPVWLMRWQQRRSQDDPGG